MSRLAVALVCLAAGAARAAPVETTTTPYPGVTHVRWTDAAGAETNVEVKVVAGKPIVVP